MSGIFIRNVTIENYKCFDNREIPLSVPDGETPGSGLNVLIGENGNGKTAILEAINYATQSSYAVENRLQIHDFHDYSKPIRIALHTNCFSCKMSAPYMGCTFDSDGIDFQARTRDRKSPGKLLSSPYSISTQFKTPSKTYKNKNGAESGKEIPPLHKMFSNGSIFDNEINIFFFDKNRSRHLSSGTYKTTFERICDDLNWKFLKSLDSEEIETLLDNIVGEYFSHTQGLAQRGAGAKLGEQASEFFNDPQYKHLRLELVNLLHPFSQAFFAIRKDGDLSQIAPKNLGSGVEIILTLLLLRNVAAESKGGIVYLLDEPELHLHPKAQLNLVEFLKEEAKTKQIVLSTHSPYLIQGCMNEAIRKLILTRGESSGIDIADADSKSWGAFPWSPSWGEVNFVAYGLATAEYHNELYGWLQEKHGKSTEREVEDFLVAQGIPKSKSWIRERNGTPEPAYDVTRPTYVRNSIHHPENRSNAAYTSDELHQSIVDLIGVI